MTDQQRRWAKLSGPYPSPQHDGMQRGGWYRVKSKDGRTGMVIVEIAGKEANIHSSYLTFRDKEPTKATRVHQPATMVEKAPGEPVAMMWYTAVCPKGHDLGEVKITTESAHCRECGSDYELEDDASA